MITNSRLIEILQQFPLDDEVRIDIDDFHSLNTREITHVYRVKNFLTPDYSIIIDADWGKRDSNIEVVQEVIINENLG